MSQRQSACVPPPSDYTPQAKPYHSSSQSKDRSNRGSGRDVKHRTHNDLSSGPSITFQSDKRGSDSRERHKQQPQDKFHRNDDDDYFAKVQDEVDEYEKSCDTNNEEDEDPLDAYMKSLEDDTGKKKVKSSVAVDDEVQVCSTSAKTKTATSTSKRVYQEPEKAKGVRLDIDETDDIEESYYKYVEEKRTQSDNQDEEDERQELVEYDNEGNILGVRKVKREVDPLPPLDHSTIVYANFEKSFYQEHEDIRKLTREESEALRAKLEIKVSGNEPPKPVCSFAHFKFDDKLMKIIRKSEFYQPTPIQAQAIPAALLGRNMIAIAMTGSGKTAAYLWPMIVHIMNQPELNQGDGPIGLVLVPTRELALQVYGEAKKFSNSHKLAVVCAYGGGSRYEQAKDLESGAEIVVATPGRIIDLIKSGATNLRRVTYLVLDEADRFFEMGFETQVRSICDHVRPDRQTLLFSATFKHRVEQLARTVTHDPIKIIQKSLGEANEDVTQHVVLFHDLTKKWDWLTAKLVEFTSAGSVLIFVTRIINSEELYQRLQDYGRESLLLHGDMEQSERNRVITAFKRNECDIMIATDVAARGLDIAHIRTVINYDVARDIDTHIHRVGRTGRAGTKGDAYTLLSTEKDKEFAGHLVRNLESSNQKVEQDLLQLAMRSHTFRKSRERRDQKSSSSKNHQQSFYQHNSGSSKYSNRHHTGDGSSHHDHQSNSSSYRHEYRNHTSSRGRGPDRTRTDHEEKRAKWH